MPTHTRQDVIDAVYARLDELLPTGQTPVVGQTMVEYELQQSYIALAYQAPEPVASMLAEHLSALNFPSYALSFEDENGVEFLRVRAPDDYLRFLWGKIDNWRRPVAEYIPHSSNMYRMLRNPYHTATYQWPAIAMIPRSYTPGNPYGESGLYFEFYPASSGLDTLESFVYVPNREFEQMPDQFVDPMIWLAVGRVAGILQRPEAVQFAQGMFIQSAAGRNFGEFAERIARSVFPSAARNE
jgi:hypothetical protein